MKKLTLFCVIILLPVIFISAQEMSSKENENINNDAFLPKPYVELEHPLWSRNATIYEVNIRQFTKEGTFSAFEGHLPRLKKMGIDIIWLMPIHPIGEKNRKGSLGSYYSVRDYLGVNPEFGSETDFRHLVDEIHRQGMYVIIDWVANHSSWDNPLVDEHPSWYSKTREGNYQPTPWYDWDDVIDFDYSNPELRRYMTEALKYWVREFDIDGYRCDVAGFIPVDFWENARVELDGIKPVFMLAEWESRDLHKRSFDMTYAWSLWDALREVISGCTGIGKIEEYLAHDVNTFPRNAYRMTFIDNHDKNSWEGNQFSNFGDALNASVVLSCVVNGMPLVYSGQEAGLDRSLKFFDKDEIKWRDHEINDIYTKLFELKHNNKALWNGRWGGEMLRIVNSRSDKVIAFSRVKDNDEVIAVFNFSNENINVDLNVEYKQGKYTDLFGDQDILLSKNNLTLNLGPWDYKVFVKK